MRANYLLRAPPISINQIVSDFDGVTFHLSTPNSKSQILISLSVKCYRELVQYGAQEVLQREYGPLIVDPEPGYDFSLLVDLDHLPAEQGTFNHALKGRKRIRHGLRAKDTQTIDIEHFTYSKILLTPPTEQKDSLISAISLLKRNAMAAPFERAFDTFAEMSAEAAKYTRESAPEGVREGGEVMAIHYRDEEAIYIKASHDRVTVIFSTIFREETDRIFGKVFLQEFVDARRRAIQNAPQVLFRNEPPLELQDVPGLKGSSKGEVGYVTFGTLDRY